MTKIQTAERVSQTDASDNYVYRRSLLAYHYAANAVSGDVLEIGTGSGYGVKLISPKAKRFITVDKNDPPIDLSAYPNVEFNRIKVPPLEGVDTNSFDYVLMFQVIEHIRHDFKMLKEIHRVLKPGGKLIISTPNKKMSLTRNPWHVREYTLDEFKNFIGSFFTVVSAGGVYGKDNVMEYYEKNRKSVESITRFDILNLERWLPRFILRIPYDILNRRNRRKLLDGNKSLTAGIKMSDYYVAQADDTCFDFIFTAEKEPLHGNSF